MKNRLRLFSVIFFIELLFVFVFTGCDFSSSGSSDSKKTSTCTITNASGYIETIKSGSNVSQNVWFSWECTGTIEEFSFLAIIKGTELRYSLKTPASRVYARNVSPGTTFEVTITPSNGNPYYFEYTIADVPEPTSSYNLTNYSQAADPKTYIYDVTNHNTVTLENDKIKKIYFLRTNPTNENATSTRYIKNVFIEKPEILPQSRNATEITDKNIVFFENNSELDTVAKATNEKPELNIIHYIDQPVEKKPLVKSNNARNIADGEISKEPIPPDKFDFSWLKIKGEMGEKREFYAQTSETERSKISATLRYIDDANKCYVWVADDCYTTEIPTDPGKKLNDEKIVALAKVFTDNVGYVRNIFGNEVDLLFYPDKENIEEDGPGIELTKASAFGDYVNFLIYDLYGDFTGEKPKSGVLGFFTNVDYYETEESLYKRTNFKYAPDDWRKPTNGGKFLHIDAAWAVSYFDNMKSTIIHEFQHLIEYGQKEIYKDTNRSETWFSEMSSMLCEDLLQEKLGLEDIDSPKNRTQKFNECYAKKSMMSYDPSSTETALDSYATSYIFGAYLSRKYGGADFVYDVMHNDKIGTEALLTEIQKRGDNWESVLRDFAADLTAGAVLNNALPITTTAHKMSGYDYPMKGFNIYGKDYNAKDLNYSGPQIYEARVKTDRTIFAYGVNLSDFDLSTKEFEKLTLSFDGETGTGVKEYLVVVKE